MNDPVFAGWFSQNGNGEMTGTTWVEESGFLEGPVMITNTHSVGVVRDAVIQWRVSSRRSRIATGYWWSLPVVAETWDGWLNDINGFHVKAGTCVSARSIPAQVRSTCGRQRRRRHRNDLQRIQGRHRNFFAQTGRESDGGYTVGVLVQCNYGLRAKLAHRRRSRRQGNSRRCSVRCRVVYGQVDRGSIIVVVATDAPLLPHQLKRLARRVSLGSGRNGSISGNGSGDIFIAFSTANPGAAAADRVVDLKMLPNDSIDPFFAATVQATEEAIVNAMIAAETMTGIENHKVIALPHDKLRAVLKKYNRLNQ